MSGIRVRLLVTGLVLWPLAAHAATSEQCFQNALRAVGTEANAILGCRARVAATNDPSRLAPCEATATAHLENAFDKLHCGRDRVTCNGKALACGAAVAGVMSDTLPSACEAAKQRAAGKLANRELGCYAKAARTGTPVDATCLTKARAKFASAIAHAGTCPDGGSPETLVESACVDQLVANQGGVVTDICPICTPVTMWGSLGTGDGQMATPFDVDVAAGGIVYVADSDNHRIQKFTSDGTFLAKWGSSGTDDGEFNRPWSVAADTSGHVYVADTGNHRVQKFADDGTILLTWGSGGTGDGQFFAPSGIAVDNDGNVLVTDLGDRLQKFSPDGTFLSKIVGIGPFVPFDNPVAVVVDASGGIYVADSGRNGIEAYTSAGGFLFSRFVIGPNGVAIDGAGTLFATRSSGIVKITSSGAVTQSGLSGDAPGQFNAMMGVAVDGDGYVYVADRQNNRIQKLSCP